jgi:hypothetical protein
MKCDCHGLTFAGGKFWINNDQVGTLLKGDGYKSTTTPVVGDVAIYRDSSGIVHSVTVAAVDENGQVTSVTGLGGLQIQSSTMPPTPRPNGAWLDANATIEYYPQND